MLSKIQSFFSQQSASFQVLSDLHLEINQQYQSYEIPPCADYLILAGDIGRLADYDSYREFLQKQTQQFKLVFLVLGNHEFYNGTYTRGMQRARQLEQEPSFDGRLVILNQRRYDVPDSCITILGCTLWSKIPHESKDVVQAKIKDFRKIKDWTVDHHNTCHDSDLAWLLEEIHSINQVDKTVKKRSQKRSILVVTHHAPSMERTSSPQHARSPWSSAFGTDILSQQSSSLDGIRVWVFGHTHYTTDFRERGVRVVSNQRGYALPWNDSKDAKSGFDVRKVIHM